MMKFENAAPLADSDSDSTAISSDNLPDALVVGIFNDQLGAAASAVDRELNGAVQRLLDQGEIRGRSGEVTQLLGHAQAPAVTVVLGLGDRESLDAVAVRRAASAAAMALAKRERPTVEFQLDLPDVALNQAALLGAATGCEGSDLHCEKRKLHPFATLRWAGMSADALEQMASIARGAALTKRLVNQPANVIYPESFVAETALAASQSGFEIEVWGQTKLEEERCDSMLAVARGSARAPQLAILRHQGAGPDAPWIAFVGKGVTFDSGGLSLKPSEGMKHMKCDMAGAATVVGAMAAIAEQKAPVNVMGLCGLVENMVGADSYRLGDVLTARSGKTIEVLNTDAEGRLVLADVLDVARSLGATKMVDLATLTGACVVALGHEAVGLMTNDAQWASDVQDAATGAGERVWELPMYPEFGEQLKSNVADVKNIGAGRWGGAITAGKFLEEFVGDTPWVHLDIAGPSYFDSASWQPAGATGAMVATLVQLAHNQSKS